MSFLYFIPAHLRYFKAADTSSQVPYWKGEANSSQKLDAILRLSLLGRRPLWRGDRANLGRLAEYLLSWSQ